jgi:hypothetical protein
MSPNASPGSRSTDADSASSRLMNQILRVLLLLLWLELGLLLILLPWSPFWETNYILNKYPSLIHILLNSYVRGAISGLGVLDAVLAVDAFRRKLRFVADRT